MRQRTSMAAGANQRAVPLPWSRRTPRLPWLLSRWTIPPKSGDVDRGRGCSPRWRSERTVPRQIRHPTRIVSRPAGKITEQSRKGNSEDDGCTSSFPDHGLGNGCFSANPDDLAHSWIHRAGLRRWFGEASRVQLDVDRSRLVVLPLPDHGGRSDFPDALVNWRDDRDPGSWNNPAGLVLCRALGDKASSRSAFAVTESECRVRLPGRSGTTADKCSLASRNQALQSRLAVFRRQHGENE